MADRLGLAVCCGVLLSMGCSMSGEHRAEELGCARQANPRTVQICRAIADEMEFELMGHVVPAPGYKVTSQTLVRVYCRLGLSKNDEAALKRLTGVGPAADHLLELVGAVSVDRGTIFHPQNPSYLLKDGCPAR